MIKKLLKFVIILFLVIFVIGVVGTIKDASDGGGDSRTTLPPSKSNSTESLAGSHKFGLSEAERRRIFLDNVSAQDELDKLAEQKYPSDPVQVLQSGRTLRLTIKTPLMPEPNPDDSLAAIARIKYLPPQTVVKSLREEKRYGNLWFYVEARTGGQKYRGWINSSALIKQIDRDFFMSQMKKQGDFTGDYSKTNTQVCNKYNITPEQLKSIVIEGIRKQWLK